MNVESWNTVPPGYDVEGQLILVVLRPDDPPYFPGLSTWQKFEYYGDPVCVRWWGDKGKTTLDAWRVDPGDIVRWQLLSGVTQSHNKGR